MAKLSAVLGSNFNSNEVAPSTPRTALPAGVYDLEITDAEIRELNSKKGTGLSITYTVVGPEEYVNRKVFQNLNIKHENAQAEQISQAQLSALCRAIDLPVLDDTDDLFGKMVRARIKVRPARGDYEESNEITAYEAIGTPLPKGNPSTPKATTGKAPWQK